jgi:hypothetical protein
MLSSNIINQIGVIRIFVCYWLNRFDGVLGKIMRKTAHPSGSVGSSNPRCLKGWRLHHHGDGIC